MTGPRCCKVAGPERRRLRFVARGQVQGVGFRPFVFSLAREHALTGFVRNSPRGVVIEAQGEDGNLTAFAHDLEHRLPPLARLTGLAREECELLADEDGFAIVHSSAGSSHSVLISPDVCLCRDCLADMADPGNRRFNYPFTNCTNCGPRFSIVDEHLSARRRGGVKRRTDSQTDQMEPLHAVSGAASRAIARTHPEVPPPDLRLSCQ